MPAPCPVVPLAPFPFPRRVGPPVGHSYAHLWPSPLPPSSLASPQGLLNEMLIQLSQVVFSFKKSSAQIINRNPWY